MEPIVNYIGVHGHSAYQGGIGGNQGVTTIVKPNTWEYECFKSEFCDGYSAGSSQYGMYDSVTIFTELLRTVTPDAKAIDARAEHVANNLIRCFEQADTLYRRMESYLNWGIQFHLSKVIDDACKQLRAAGPGDVVLIPIITGSTPTGSQNLCLMMVTAISDSLCRVSIINPNPLCSYHPKKATPPKMRQMNVLQLSPVPKERIQSEAFWSCVYLGTGNFDDSIFYTHYLTWLTKRTFEGQIGEGLHSAAYEAPTKSECSVFWKSLVSVLKHMLRVAGVKPVDIKNIRFLMKQQMLRRVRSDLDGVAKIKLSQRRLIETAAKNTAMAISRTSGQLKPAQLDAARCAVDDLQEVLANIPCDDDSTTQPPPALDLVSGWDQTQQPDRYPMMECFRRIESVQHFVGALTEHRSILAVNLDALPSAIHTIEELSNALADIVRMITRLGAQAQILKNVNLTIMTLVTHFVTEVLPMPKGPKARAEAAEVTDRPCIWATPQKYGQQMQMLMRLSQLCEYYLGACFGYGHSRAYDPVRLTVVGALAIMCDALIRQPATDHPSLPSQHIAGVLGTKNGRFMFSSGKYATQTEGIEVTYPEVLVARCAVLDYINDVLENIHPTHVMWKWEDGLKECRATNILMKSICSSEAFTNHSWSNYLVGNPTGEFCIMCKYFPDLRYYRDVVYFFKLLQHSRLGHLPSTGEWVEECRGTPIWRYDSGEKEYSVEAYQESVQIRAVGPRYGSHSNPSVYTSPIDIACEDDLLHIKNLPNFDDTMGQRDAELLLSYLTVPYLRIPLVLRFLATEDRVSFLSSKEVRWMLDGVLFEPGRFLARDLTDVSPTEVPTENAALIATPYGLLLNELQYSTDGVVEPLIRLLELARAMDAGTVHNEPTTTIILYLVRLVCRVESFLYFLLSRGDKKPPLRDVGLGELRGVSLSGESVHTIRAAYRRLRDMARTSVQPMLETWIEEVRCTNAGLGESNTNIDDNTRIACRLHGHLVVLNRNIFPEDLTPHEVTALLSSMAFLTTRHTWNQGKEDKENSDVPETEIYEVMQKKRREVLAWMYNQSPDTISRCMDTLVAAATSSTMTTNTTTISEQQAAQHHHEWVLVAGSDCVGRFARVDTEEMMRRPNADGGVLDLLASLNQSFGTTTMPKEVRTIALGMQEVEFNCQTWSLTFKAAHLQALPSNIASNSVVANIFGKSDESRATNTANLQSMQCALLEEGQNRQWYRLVGQDCDIMYWSTADPRIALPGDVARFYPEDIRESETWVTKLMEPVRMAFFERSFWEPPIFILLPEVPLTPDQSVAVLSAVDSRTGRKMKEIVIFRDYEVLHIYDVFSYGRRFHRSLMYTTDARFCLHQLQPYTGARSVPWSWWARHAAGDGNPDSNLQVYEDAVVVRHASHPENLSESTETFLPQKLLDGLIPTALLDTHLFWQDADDNIRGYPIKSTAAVDVKDPSDQDATTDHLLWIHWKEIEFNPLTTKKNTCVRIVRYANARDAPKASDNAVQKSEKLKIKTGTEEEIDVVRDMESEGAGGDVDEGMYRAAATATDDKTSETNNKTATATVEEKNLLLLNLMYARKGTPLHSLANVLARIELLSHILVWTTQTDYDYTKGGPIAIDLVQLPRLKLSFRAHVDGDGAMQLFSLDHASLFVSNVRQPLVNELLQGIPHSLLLCDSNQATSILVPNLAVERPHITRAPYSTELVLDRKNEMWARNLDTRYYLYPVHVSLSFVFTPTLSSALYLLLLRFLHRNYDDVFRLAGTIGTDMQLTAEEQQVFDYIGCVDDNHPNAHACRAKIGLLTSDSPMSLAWYNPLEVAMSLQKSSQVTVSCRLSFQEERRLMFICHALERKMEVVREVAKAHSDATALVKKRIVDEESIYDGSLQERKLVRAFTSALQTKLREKLDAHVTKDEMQRMLRVWYNFAARPMETYYRCLLDNQLRVVEAEAAGLESGVTPQPAAIRTPPIGEDLHWHLYRDFNALTVKPPGSLNRLKNDEGRAVTMSLQSDVYYCGQTTRKSGQCKCKNCDAECGPESGCPCASCERFNKKEGPKLRQLPEDLEYNRMYRTMSFFEVFMWMRNLFSGYHEYTKEKRNPEKLRSVFHENNSFLLYYELITGTTSVKIGSQNCAADLPALLFPFCREACNPNSGLGHFMHFLLNNPAAAPRLARWNRTSKQKHSLRVLTIFNSIFEVAAMYREVPPTIESFSKIPKAAETIDITPRPEERATPSLPLSKTRILPLVPNTSCSLRKLEIPNLAHLALVGDDTKFVTITPPELAALAQNPLQALGIGELVVQVTRTQQKLPPLSETLPFDISSHPAAQTSVAKSLLERTVEDMKTFATRENKEKMPKLRGLTTELEIRNLIKRGASANLSELVSSLRSLLARINKLRDKDIEYVGRALPIAQRSANAIPMTNKEDMDSYLLYLRRYAGQEATLPLDYMMSSLCADDCVKEWRKLNPFLTVQTCGALINILAVAILRANRIGHAARTAESIESLLALLQKVMQSAKSAPSGGAPANDDAVVASVIQRADAVAHNLTTARVYIKPGELTYDPRFLIFEFTWGITLRSRQIELVNEMYASTLTKDSLVKQMIMGAGKTTVVGPLLGLMLADGQNLVVQVVPPALLDFSRSVLRSTFSCLLTKQIFSFVCDRSGDIDSEVLSKFQHAQQSRGIVVTTPSTLKSVFLKYIETLHMLENPGFSKTLELQKQSEELTKLLRLWKKAVLVMDEVDMLLHPLKSELNFPIGEKRDIDFTPMRWKLPIHILDALFYWQTKRISLQIKDSPEAHTILRDFAVLVRDGLAKHALQQMPHLTLLNVEYYHTQLKTKLAEWVVLFVKAQHFIGLSDEEMCTYMCTRPSESDAPELVAKVKGLEPAFIKILNLCYDWLNCFLPHVLQKIDRVTFGILNMDDIKRTKMEQPNAPRSRLVTAIPFVGKDLPSQSSEFAHPDVVIGLTVLAYRYEGLRDNDFVDIMRDVQSAVEKEVGRFSQRRTNLMYVRWVRASRGKIMTSYSYNQKKSEEEEMGMQPSESCALIGEADIDDDEVDRIAGHEVLPLRLMTQANKNEFDKLFKLLRRTPEVIHWYLCENVFPEYMRHQATKLSASGQELGGDILFDTRLGFSGTPSDLLPVELGRCDYEPCTEGKLIHTLTSPDTISYRVVDPGWTVRGLLNYVATTTSPAPFHALIDTGALITGMSNLQVAKYLLAHGLENRDGVVFLDEWDRKMILVRSTGRVLRLAECGIPKERRFAFYDQVHTTGMDIDHTPNAQAVLTLGKDMTFRDYSQGAYRMRGISQGQTVQLLIIPEVYDMIMRTLRPTRKGDAVPDASIDALPSRKPVDVLVDVSAWLFVNSILSEHTQYKQLCLQNVSNVWRKEGYKTLAGACERGEFRLDGKVADETLKALTLFREPVDFSVSGKVPQLRMFSEGVEAYIAQHAGFIRSDAGKAVIAKVVAQTKAEDEIENPTIDIQMVQEQEEEREQEAEQEREQEIEIEKFVDLEYSRDEEQPDSWKLATLGNVQRAFQFYKLQDFHLYKRSPIAFPDNILLSRNFYNPRWSGHRRLKNVIMTMEWTPSTSGLKRRERPSRDYGEFDAETSLREITNTLSLLRQHQTTISRELLKELYMIALQGVSPDDEEWQAVLDAATSLEELDALAATVLKQLSSNCLRQEEDGRFVVAVALCEAETLRRVLHLRKRSRESILGGSSSSDVEFALRINSSNNALLDASHGFHAGHTSQYQCMKAHNCLRFFDSDYHFLDQEIALLLRALHCTPKKHRQAFFQQVMACRRRSRQRWEITPVSLIFNLASAYTLLHQRAVGLCMKRELDARELPVTDAYLAFNASHSGMMLPSELWGGMRWCRLLEVTAEDVLNFIEVADTHKESTLHYADFLALVVGDRNYDDEGDEPEEGGEGKKLPTIEPYGSEELRVLEGERVAVARRLEDEANREAAAEDERVLQEIEYEFDKDEYDTLTGGTNPRLIMATGEGDTPTSLEYRFDAAEHPKLTAVHGLVTELEDDGVKMRQLCYDAYYKASLRSLKLVHTDGPVVDKYNFTVEFRMPRIGKTTGAIEAAGGNDITVCVWPMNRYLLRTLGGSRDNRSDSSDDDNDDDDDEYDYDYDEDEGDSNSNSNNGSEGENALLVYPEAKVNETQVLYRLHIDDTVEEDTTVKRHTSAVDSVTIEWMKIRLPVEGWVAFERSGRALFEQLYLMVCLEDGGQIRVCSYTFDLGAVQPETIDILDTGDDGLAEEAARLAEEEDEEEDDDDIDLGGMGDVQDLVDALKKAKELKVGDKVSRNPECWTHGNEDGGEGSVGKVLKVEDETVQVQWPSGNKGDYEWGRQGKFCLIKVADAVEGEDEEGEDRDTYNDERWMGDITKKKNCEECGKKKMELGDWYRCNQCDNFNLCKKCFR
eukprot:PhM_4_TR2411/c0_g2_i1/m.74313